MLKHIILFFCIVIFNITAHAKEGMWLPLLVEQLNIGEMQADGFRLTAIDIYSVNQASMKDGIMLFGRGCTGVAVSESGLILTNHHCGFSYFQRHSSVENDYLTDGFWAMNQNEELPNPGLSVTFLKYMKDVTEEVLNGVDDSMQESERRTIISSNRDSILKKLEKDSTYDARISTFYEGNQFFLFVSETFTDIRLVGAPPSSVGGFGGNIDNWVWPRHGGDFSLFRIYADANNKPKDYSDDNVPYKPAHVFPVSLKGVEKDDFTMVFGYPGTTQQYKTSHHLKMLTESLYPKLIDIRTIKLDILNYHMNLDAERRIKYAGKEASLSNAWKRWQGELKGLDRFKAIEKKEAGEAEFQTWANNLTHEGYANLLGSYETYYKAYSELDTDMKILSELFGNNSMEGFYKATQIYNTIKLAERNGEKPSRNTFDKLYKDYDRHVDRELTVKLLAYMFNYPNQTIVPQTLSALNKKYKGNIEKVTDYLFKKSFVEDSLWIPDYFNGKKSVLKKLEKDPFRQIYNEYLSNFHSKFLPEINHLSAAIDSTDRVYMKALMEFDSLKTFYPDANSTLRITWGNVSGYEPLDGVYYKHYTSSEGILQKDNPEIYDYNVPDKLRKLLKEGDFYPYSNESSIPVCFVASNHTTGGNSGSPVINANGELVGLNFDRAWDGVMSDLHYNSEICRNISVDVRYVLFIIDKFADAGYLLNEMKIIR